jgi:hypothetical protein
LTTTKKKPRGEAGLVSLMHCPDMGGLVLGPAGLSIRGRPIRSSRAGLENLNRAISGVSA